MSAPRMALVAREEGTRFVQMEIPEDQIETARELGWEVVMRETDIPPSPHDPVEPHQSNVKRKVTPEDEEC